MKQSFHSRGLLFFLLILFFLSLYTTAATRRLTEKHDEEKVKVNGLSQMGNSREMKEENLWNMMGAEDCDNGDEECLKRRLIADAHLDYIYTQHHKNP